MLERLLQGRDKVGRALSTTYERLQGLREPVEARSREQFMGLVNRGDGSIVTLQPYANSERYEYRMSDGPTGELLEFKTGFRMRYRTYWSGRTPTGRRVSYEDNHGTRNPYSWGSNVEEAKHRLFRLTVEAAKDQHETNPKLKFLVSGSDGLQDYTHYMGVKFTK